MTDAPESRTEVDSVSGERATEPTHYNRPSRLTQVVAWVGIAAGVVFIVAVIFFSGFFLGWSSGGRHGSHYGWHHGYYNGQMGPGGPMGPGGMMGPGGPMGPGGMMGPSPTPPTTKATGTPRP